MASRTRDFRATVRSEGGLLPPDLLDRIVDPKERELPGLDPVGDYGLPDRLRMTEAAARSWEHAKAYWGAFKARLEGSRPGTELGITRQHWLIPFLDELGYAELDFRQQAETVSGREFRISHRASPVAGGPPLHLVAFSQALDKSDATSPGLKASPHGLLQSYLNATDHLWGIVSNGRQLRILRDNASLTRPAYLEFDLEGMMEGGVFADFTLCWMVAHSTRLPKSTTDASSCFLERWYNAALVRGARALGDLRVGVEQAIRALGQGFVDHRANGALRAKLASGELDSAAYYRQLLRMVYRLLFLLVAEERDLLFPPGAPARGRSIFADNYSVSRLRDHVRRQRGDDRHDDLWRAQRVAFEMLREGNSTLGLPPLGGGIFDPRMCPDLGDAQLGNDSTKAAIRGLSLAPTKSGYRRINYRDLDVEELGSVYESLLDEQPVLKADGGRPQFTLASGGERKSTGSYYTPSVLVQELIRSALDPVIHRALASAPDIAGKRTALLDLAVCDPACGSGHFLLAAARRIGHELARLASGEHEPDPAVLRHAIREAITHCVYGVDLNPLAVDLCRLALWLEGHEPGRPLGFMDHHIKLGNSLVGATAALVQQGIPTEAFEPVEGDSKSIAKEVKKRNREELERPQLQLFGMGGLEPAGPTDEEAKEARAIGDFEEEAPDDVALKEAEYEEFSARLAHKRRAADLWTAAFFWPLREGAPAPPTQSVLLHHRAGRDVQLGPGERQLATILEGVRPFHWELEFPDVFSAKDGFDCMLGNPPWEMTEVRHAEFFGVRNPPIARAQTSAIRSRMIAELEISDPELFRAFYDYARSLAAQRAFATNSGRYPLSTVGRFNLYGMFVELSMNLINDGGRAGQIVPSGIATDSFKQKLFNAVSDGARLVSLYDFENSQGLFEGVHRSYKFCLLTLRGSPDHSALADFAFFATSIDHLREPDRHFTLTAADFALFNPNTHTCPVFRSKRDAEIARKLYGRSGVFWKEPNSGEPEDNPWGIKLQLMFMMNTDSHLFCTKDDLVRDGLRLEGNVFIHPDGREYLPLYEAKLFHQYDHRFATFGGASREDTRAGNARDMTAQEKSDPSAVVIPRYWVPAEEVTKRLDMGAPASQSIDETRRDETRRVPSSCRSGRWQLAFRQFTNATNQRTAILAVIPRVAPGETASIMVPLAGGRSPSATSREPRTNGR